MLATNRFTQMIQRELVWLYPWLIQLSRRLLRNERFGHTMQPTALAHEVLGKLLVLEGEITPTSKRDLQLLSASLAKRTLIDSGRRFAARQKALAHITSEAREHQRIEPQYFDELLVALERLQEIDSQISRLAELRFFEGYSEEEAAEILGISVRTASRKWKFAKAYIKTHVVNN